MDDLILADDDFHSIFLRIFFCYKRWVDVIMSASCRDGIQR